MYLILDFQNNIHKCLTYQNVQLLNLATAQFLKRNDLHLKFYIDVLVWDYYIPIILIMPCLYGGQTAA